MSASASLLGAGTVVGALTGGVVAGIPARAHHRRAVRRHSWHTPPSPMARGRSAADRADERRAGRDPAAPDGPTSAGVPGTPACPWPSAGSFLAGNVSGLLGVGGGIVTVPLMHLTMGAPMRVGGGDLELHDRHHGGRRRVRLPVPRRRGSDAWPPRSCSAWPPVGRRGAVSARCGRAGSSRSSWSSCCTWRSRWRSGRSGLRDGTAGPPRPAGGRHRRRPAGRHARGDRGRRHRLPMGLCGSGEGGSRLVDLLGGGGRRGNIGIGLLVLTLLPWRWLVVASIGFCADR